MAATALVKFIQGALVGTPGVALAGVGSVQVSVENDSPTSVASWKIDLLYVPPGSAVVPGTLAAADGAAPFANFTPDLVPGCYRIMLTVYESVGQTGVSNVDIRNFVVPDASGFVYPPYQQLPPKLPVTGSGIIGEKPDELNLLGQPFGWDGVGNEGLLLDFMKQTSALIFSGGASGGGGWVRVVDIDVQGSGTVSGQVYNDPGPNTIIESATVSEDTVVFTIEASFPNVLVNGVPGTLPHVGDIYKGTINHTVPSPGPTVIPIVTVNPDGAGGASDDVTLTVEAPPQILTLSFAAQGGGAGGAPTYPGAQTELKAGDTIRVEGTTDKDADALIVSDLGAGIGETVVFASGTFFSVFITVADRGISVQDLAATIAARDSVTTAVGPTRTTDFGGGSADGVDLVKLNNIFPGIVFGAINYPASQAALKGGESATVPNALTNFDTVLYDDPTAAELTIPSPAVSSDPKSVTRLGGAYNVSVPNFRVTATRAANAAVTVDQLVVQIANVAAQLTVTEPAARLRSGGNDGTAPQDHTITITSDQELFVAPTLAPDGGGTRGAFVGAFVGGPTVWTADLRVDETLPDEKGAFAWGAILGTNLADTDTVAITGDANYELGGFVLRTKTFPAFAATVQIGTEIVDYSKLTAGIFTSTGNPALKQVVGYSVPVPDTSVTDGYSGDAVGVDPTTIEWVDEPARAANSGGTAQLTDIEETV